jgi:redox-sensing transcriptional repressor
MTDVLRAEDIRIGIITVPADKAQDAADALVRGGVKGILNFAPARLRVPADVFVTDVDMTMSLEKVAFFAKTGGQ